MKKYLLLTFLTISSLFGFSQCGFNPVNHWEVVVKDNTTWKYIVPNSTLSNWEITTYNDASWASGTGGMGFGDNDDNTVIPSTSRTVYMRKTFNIVDTALIHQVILCMDYDDGFVAYINGIEVARSNIDPNQEWDDFATQDHEAQLYQNQQPDYYSLSIGNVDTLLYNGINTLSIEVHNNSSTSLDLTARPFLMLGIKNTSTNYLSAPSWFIAPNYMPLQSNLPLLVINTLGQTIVDNPRINCDMGIIYNGVGQQNCILDPFNDYNGKISIEHRGSTSQSFPKMPFGFSTITAAGANQNVSLLGMPAEHDWVLLNTYNDKTFMRDALTYDLGRALGWYASREQHVEVVINGVNQGVYVLLEKIKRDKNRVDIAKLDTSMNSGDALTGGYIFKIDKFTGNSGPGWNTTNQGVSIQNEYPKWDEITSTQNTYLKNYIDNFESVLFSPTFTDPNIGYRKVANVYSFVDWFIINEVSNNVDGYRLSTYMHKDRNSNCGRFTMGPLWDFNISFGNGNYCNGYQTAGWQMYNGCGDGSSKWIDKMLQDPYFKNLLNCRWNELRTTTLSTPAILARLDTFTVNLRPASIRDSAIWQTIGTYVWPNGWIANSWQGEVDSLKLWITNRMTWLDANMYATTQPCNATSNSSLVIDEINFNSDNTLNAGDWLELYNYGTTSLDISNAIILDGDQYEKYCVIPNGTTLAAGARLVIYADSALFAAQFPTVTNKIGPLCFKLNNAGQKLVIRDKDSKFITSVDFYDTWQCSTDGNGRTLELVSASSNPNNASSWFAGCMGGSPGVAYNPCVETPIYSEINYNSSTTADAGDWIELYNKNNTPFSLAGWTIKNGDDLNAYTFPANASINANQYLVLYEDAAKFNTQFPSVTNSMGPIGFSLSNTVDVIRLFDNLGTLKYSVCYGVNAPWPTDANGLGKTLENGLYAGNHNAAATWFAGCPQGSPGMAYDPACKPLGLQDIEDNSYLAIYPNPATNVLHIQSTKSLNNLSVFDAAGQVQAITTSADKKEINIAALANGMYILQCADKSGKTYYVKFNKQ